MSALPSSSSSSNYKRQTCLISEKASDLNNPATDSNKNLVLGPKWVHDTKTDGPTDHRS
jgi:hypothetical protein